nr:XdhC family protein [Parvularcula maris]
MVPPLRLVVIGKGEEAEAFCRLALGGGYDVLIYSPDAPLLGRLAGEGVIGAKNLSVPGRMPDMPVDAQTASALFFHDHEWEPAALRKLLGSPAFWVGAQGSSRAAEARKEALRALGTEEKEISRLRGRIGLIPSARDPQTLAVSVLADIVAAYKSEWLDPYQEQPSHLRAVS